MAGRHSCRFLHLPTEASSGTRVPAGFVGGGLPFPSPLVFLLISDELRVRESLSQRLILRETETLGCLLPRKARFWGKELWSGGGELG